MTYYLNALTGQSQYEFPECPAAALESPAEAMGEPDAPPAAAERVAPDDTALAAFQKYDLGNKGYLTQLDVAEMVRALGYGSRGC
jgi:hypothetical protein